MKFIEENVSTNTLHVSSSNSQQMQDKTIPTYIICTQGKPLGQKGLEVSSSLYSEQQQFHLDFWGPIWHDFRQLFPVNKKKNGESGFISPNFRASNRNFWLRNSEKIVLNPHFVILQNSSAILSSTLHSGGKVPAKSSSNFTNALLSQENLLSILSSQAT